MRQYDSAQVDLIQDNLKEVILTYHDMNDELAGLKNGFNQDAISKMKRSGGSFYEIVHNILLKLDSKNITAIEAEDIRDAIKANRIKLTSYNDRMGEVIGSPKLPPISYIEMLPSIITHINDLIRNLILQLQQAEVFDDGDYIERIKIDILTTVEDLKYTQNDFYSEARNLSDIVTVSRKTMFILIDNMEDSQDRLDGLLKDDDERGSILGELKMCLESIKVIWTGSLGSVEDVVESSGSYQSVKEIVYRLAHTFD